MSCYSKVYSKARRDGEGLVHFYHAWFRRAPHARLIRPQHRSQRADVLSETDRKLTLIGKDVTLLWTADLAFRDDDECCQGP
jgi:hypothetical protein